MKIKIPHIAFVFGVLMACTSANAQDLEKIGDKDAVTISGGMTFNTINYFSQGMPGSLRDPFTWYATGNLTINVLDVALPFTYSYTNYQGIYTQPFNMVAFHPKYKWATAHIGITNMQFSRYTLAGHTFAGAGLDLTPGKWKISLMGGRLNKAIEAEPFTDPQNITYRRMGYGLSAGYQNKGHSLTFIAFKGEDDPNSLTFIPPNADVTPEENFVSSLKGKTTLMKGLTLEAEYALSALTQNTAYPDPYAGSSNLFRALVDHNSTTDYYQAYNGALSYQMKNMSFALKMEHVDPGYRTLGGYFFNNDLENYTFAPSFRLLKNKLNLSFNTGFQRNNLAADKSATTRRWIGSVNAAYTVNQRLMFNAAYSNFSSFTRNRPNTDPFYYQPADTLNFYQVNQNGSLAAVMQLGKKDSNIGHSLQLLFNHQESVSLQGALTEAGAFGMNVNEPGIPAVVDAANLAYTYQIKPKKTAISFGVNANQSTILDQTSLFFGPSLNYKRPVFKEKVNLTLGTTYNRNHKNNTLANHVLNHRLSATHAIKLKTDKVRMNLSINGNYLQKLAVLPTENNRSEINIFGNLSLGF